MAQITLIKRVNAPIEQVFEMLTQLERAPERMPSIKKLEVLTSGPFGRGTKFRETRVMFGREATETMEVTDFQPGRSMTISATSCGSRFDTVFNLSRDGRGTIIEQITSWRAVTLFARLMSPMSVLMTGMMRKMMQKDLDDAAASIERGG